MNTRTLLPAIGLTLLLSACSLDIPKSPTQPTGSGAVRSAPSAPEGMRVYSSKDHGFSITYPSRWRVRQDGTVVTPEGERAGVTFVGGSAEAPGTALLEATAQVAPLAGACPADTAGPQVVVNGLAFARKTWDEAGAGNRYTGVSYATEAKGRCYVLTFLTHLCNLGPDCGTEHALPFDNKDLEAAYSKMVNSFKVL